MTYITSLRCLLSSEQNVPIVKLMFDIASKLIGIIKIHKLETRIKTEKVKEERTLKILKKL